MTIQDLKNTINELCEETGWTFLQACSYMQAAAAKKGREDLITFIHHLKMDSIVIED